MTSHRANKRTYSETPTRALDFTKPSLSLQDKEPITRPSYTSNKNHPHNTPHAKHTRTKNRLFIKCLSCLWTFVDGGEEAGFLPAAQREVRIIMHLFSCCGSLLLKIVCRKKTCCIAFLNLLNSADTAEGLSHDKLGLRSKLLKVQSCCFGETRCCHLVQ